MNHTLLTVLLYAAMYLCLGMTVATAINFRPAEYVAAAKRQYETLQAERGESPQKPPLAFYLLSYAEWAIALLLWLPAVTCGFLMALWLGVKVLRRTVGKRR
jgi:hypothetical protein